MIKQVLYTSAVTIGFLTTPAFAQPNHPTLIGVYDSRNTFIGTLMTIDQPYHDFNGTYYSFSVDKVGPITNALFLYPNSGCTGTAYDQNVFDSIYVPKYASYDGKILWTAGDATLTITVQSYNATWDGRGCQKGYWGAQTLEVSPFVELDSTFVHSLLPPFSTH